MTSIIIVSGGTGSSARHLVQTALAQFPDADLKVEMLPVVRKPAELEEIIARAATSQAIVTHTLVDSHLRRKLIALAREYQVTEVDLMGPLLEQVGQHLGQAPLEQPGLYRKQNEEDLRRVEAIDFTVEHDDGKRVDDLGQAQIVLAGVSRVGKTPLSIYLATLGWKVANVPIIKGIQPPKQLFQIDAGRVVGLTVQPGQLVLYRQIRARHMGIAQRSTYAQAEASAEELEYAHTMFRRGKFRIVDTTDKSIEEAAQEVLNAVRSRI